MHTRRRGKWRPRGRDDSAVDVLYARKAEENFLILANVGHRQHGLVKQRKSIRVSLHLSSGKAYVAFLCKCFTLWRAHCASIRPESASFSPCNPARWLSVANNT